MPCVLGLSSIRGGPFSGTTATLPAPVGSSVWLAQIPARGWLFPMRILLVDDHQILLQGLRGMLESHPDYEVVGEASNGRIAVEMARELKPDAVLMDVAMPDLNGIEATRQIVGESPSIKVIALSMHEDPLFVREMLRAGASGYLLKESAFDEVIRALNAVTSNQAFFSPAVARVVMGDYLDRGDGKPVPPEKTGTRVFD